MEIAQKQEKIRLASGSMQSDNLQIIYLIIILILRIRVVVMHPVKTLKLLASTQASILMLHNVKQNLLAFRSVLVQMLIVVKIH